ncbi:uncharacterized protein DSM5745_02652 [Aspergillus mulundensis]|uniref:HAUS augmin-like complex subunit 3 N-terminal domain-containing protein n=1 Tax=Aspergillus mulundensis TaxID=1810919 RepID=A0A3D8SX26_9EURO|nr:Uncharacterized protein DSM5745_02652 [Aspergillus mulundensis]RDW90877.1 Uncharacterized protein DSM5745_02652 [Aspergillus mulundensis]
MDPQEVVISALKERNIPPKRDEITSAFRNEINGVGNTEWVQEHLTPDTLLSQEELRLYALHSVPVNWDAHMLILERSHRYSKLEESGALPALFSDANFDSTRPFLDDDLQRAIEALNTSTANIQRQIDILTSQYEILHRQHKRGDDQASKQNREVERLRRKHEAATQNTAAAISEMVHELEVSLKNESEKSTMDGKKILSALTVRLKDNDKLLSDIEALASGVKSFDGDASTMKRTTELSSILSKYVAEEIYCRLDRLYLEKLLDGSKSVSDVPTDKDTETVAGLEQETDSLYPEIDILAEMSTKQQFVEPILRQLRNHHGQLRIASHQKLDLILKMVMDMTTSTENLITALQDRESLCATLEAFASAYRSEVGDQILDSNSSRRETMRRFSTQPTSMSVQPGRQLGHFPECEALSGLLRRLGLSFEAVFQAEQAEGGIQTLITERQHMLDGLHNYGIASDSPLAVELLPTDRATRLVYSALEADSLFTTSLSSMEHERSLSELESKLSRIQKGIERLNYDVVYQRNKNKESFLERWG